MNSKVKDRLRKLLELSRRGIDGEKISAERILHNLLEKHNLSLNDIESDIKKLRFYNYTTLDKQQIISQIICAVTNSDRVGVWPQYKELGIEVTAFEHAKITELIDFHITQYEKEKKKLIKDLPVAYINKHRIFSDKTSAESKKPEDIDWDEIERLRNLANSMEDVSFTKKLTTSKELS